MLKTTIFQHKAEKEKLLSEKYILREKLGCAKKFLETDLIKLITGPRSGKSVFAISLLNLEGKDFAYLNFDEESFLKIKNYDEIIKVILRFI
jgi:predicted AAA+ superfamily ATPase